MTQSFTDSHCHLDAPEFNADRDAVIERARAAGITYLLTVGGGGSADDLAAGIPIAAGHEWIYATVGIHPHEAAHAEPKHLEMLGRAASEPKVLAIGEIGLDYYYDHSPRDVQKRVLIDQLQIARQAKLPIVIHCRDAWADLSDIIAGHWSGSGLGGILHCFTGDRPDAFRFLDWGFLVSFAGNITFKKAESLRAVAREIPLDRLLTETDSPYLTPEPNRGKRNEPAYALEIVRQLATLRDLTVEDMGALTAQNFANFFHLRSENNPAMRMVRP